MVEESVAGLEDSVVTEMTKEVLHEKVCEVTRWFQARFMGQEGAPSFGGIVKWYS